MEHHTHVQTHVERFHSIVSRSVVQCTEHNCKCMRGTVTDSVMGTPIVSTNLNYQHNLSESDHMFEFRVNLLDAIIVVMEQLHLYTN